jgi:hypothetical protein
VFHVELRRFPHVARAFNLSAEELDARIVTPFVRGQPVELDDRQWAPEKTRVLVYDGPPIAPEDRGLGRGWALVTRDGEDVTAALLDAARKRLREPSSDTVKQQLLAASERGISLAEAVSVAERSLPGRRASEALSLAELAVWELLHEGSVILVDRGQVVSREGWEPLLLGWDSWSSPGIELVAQR